jgi:hypothetical protein
MKLFENICHPTATPKNITLSTSSSYLIEDRLQVETDPTTVLMKIMGKTGMLVCLVDLGYQEITLSAGGIPAWTASPAWS